VARAALIAIVFSAALSACAGAPVAAWRKVTAFPRPAFSNPGDSVTLAPTADTWPYDADGDTDCARCPPR
jgi:hypothetical protein